ncbi:MAG: hypothetical protein O7B35_18950 [Deltaproteobacteria bacterium]|nr:hypothetical protein [Deltaproteobacteria bacterium]
MSSTIVSCPHCNSEKIRTQRIPLANGGHHIKASCAACGKFIKFIPHEGLRFHFGKHRGKTVIEVAANDPSYLSGVCRRTFSRIYA